LPACVYIGTHIESPGIIFQKGGSNIIYMGSDPNNPKFNLSPLFDLFNGASIAYEFKENVNVEIWSKYMFIAAYGLVTAAYCKTLGEVYNDRELNKITKAIMEEINEIARKMNIFLEDKIIEKSIDKARQFPHDVKTSFQRDVELKGKVNEGDIFGGTIIRLGEEFGINTPFTEKIYKKLVN